MNETQAPSIQWFPGHMAKTRRMIQANLKLVDLVAELRDSRIPLASANPDLEKLSGSKPRMILLNKCDLADENQTKKWIRYYQNQNIPALAVDCRSGKGLQAFRPAVKEVLSEQIRRFEQRGMVGRPLRLMVVGIPNAGKSSLINRLASGKRTKVEDRPGVTRGKQWISVDRGMELLDMPGVLWPKFDDSAVAEHLAFTGAIKDDIMDLETLAMRLLERLIRDYPVLLHNRYRLDPQNASGMTGFELLEQVGKNRGMLISGGEINTERAAITVLDEFRAGVIGRITLESAPEQGDTV